MDYLIDILSDDGRDPYSTVTGRGVIIRRSFEKLMDHKRAINLAPDFEFKGIDEKDLIRLTRLSLGPKVLLLRGRNWMEKDIILREIVSVKNRSRKRVSGFTQVIAIREQFVLKAILQSRRLNRKKGIYT